MSVKSNPLKPNFIYRKNGVYRGILIFLILNPKHRLCVPTINVFSKYIKNIIAFLMKFSIFTAEKKNLCTSRKHVRVIYTPLYPTFTK